MNLHFRDLRLRRRGRWILLSALIGTVSGFGAIAFDLMFRFSEHTLLGGVGTVLGPLLGTVIMFYLVDIAGDFTSAYLLLVGLALVLMVLFFPRGILGTVRQKAVKWLP